ncbi:MAG TPA: FtsX-like permease family protein [Candidatus Jorgensenbacteria bacterium]|nr:FtsX-like permease family protein [Candidatus Jorgensenbacteria bacterium]
MLQQITQAAISSISSLWENKVRSIITMIGIVIGVSSVLIIMSIGVGAQSLILSQIESLGSNLISVSPGHAEEGDMLAGFFNFAVTTLKYNDVTYLRSNRYAPNLVDVAGYNRGFGVVKWRSESYDTSLNGTTASYLTVEGSEIEVGRFFTEEEEINLSRVAVLGSAVKQELFGESDTVGQRIKIGGASYEVIGVIKERGTVGLEDYDDQVLLPIRTTQRMMGINHIGLIRARVDSDENIDKSIEDIKVLLREQHGIRDQSGKSDDFSVGSSVQTLSLVTTITDGLRFFLTAMAALSLLVGGIGIMNIMLISVTERTREIGLRKAVGANNFDILGQFLLEAVFVTGLGSIIGIVIGIIVSFLIAIGVRFAGFDWAFVISPSSIVLALVVSAGIGLFFGYYPALKASKLDPIEALRYE